MRQLKEFARSFDGFCACMIAVCFSLTSQAYLSWLYHLMTVVEAAHADVYSMVIGYLFQAAGTVAGVAMIRRKTELEYRNAFWTTLILFFLVTVPALLCRSLFPILLFGFAMNALCGIIASFYLYIPARCTEKSRGFVFGAGYGISTIMTWLLSKLGGQNMLSSQGALVICFVLAVVAALMAVRIFEGIPDVGSTGPGNPDVPSKGLSTGSFCLISGTIILLSLVKNLGFSFPSSDIKIGINLELSRLFYAIGLIAAGIISDRNRRYGAICTMAALAIPFVMLSVANEPLPRFMCWSLDYLFFGFFSVFRVVLFLDISRREKLFYLAPVGLAAGRIGDAVGTALCIGLGGHKVILVALTTVLFMLATVLFFRLFHTVYEPEKGHERSEREIFEAFAIQHDLSAREKEVLRLLLAEHSNSEIAEALFVSESTIKYHVHNLLQKTGSKSRQELVKKYNIALFPQLQTA